jgi:hypothetical protein
VSHQYRQGRHRRVVLEASVLGRIVGWSNDDAVREMVLAILVVNENRSRDDGSRSNSIILLDDRLHIVRGQHSSAVRCAGPESGCVSFPM